MRPDQEELEPSIRTKSSGKQRRKPAHATHWTTRTLARVLGISEATVRRAWHAHGLKPHLVDTFKVSRDPQFVEKLEDIVGLYLNPPQQAMYSRWKGFWLFGIRQTNPGQPRAAFQRAGVS